MGSVIPTPYLRYWLVSDGGGRATTPMWWSGNRTRRAGHAPGPWPRPCRHMPDPARRQPAARSPLAASPVGRGRGVAAPRHRYRCGPSLARGSVREGMAQCPGCESRKPRHRGQGDDRPPKPRPPTPPPPRRHETGSPKPTRTSPATAPWKPEPTRRSSLAGSTRPRPPRPRPKQNWPGQNATSR